MTTYTSFDQLPMTLCADDIASVLGISRVRAYDLLHTEGFPRMMIGKRLLVPRERFLEWMNNCIDTGTNAMPVANATL